MSIGRTSRATSLAFSLGLALSCAACTSEPSKNLFGDAPDDSAGASNASGSKSGSGGSLSGNAGESSSGATQGGDGGSTANDTGGATSSGATNGGGGAPSAGGTNAAGGASSGGVATAAGGTGSGGKNTSAGGQTADGGTTGSGGNATDAGAGGDQDSGSSTGGSPPTERRVRCGTTTCDLSAGEACCVRDVSGGMGPGGGMTHQAATCAKDVMNCDRVFRCDSDADCAHGEHCCLDFTSSDTMPNAACSARACDSPLSCSVPADCPSGKTCCGTIGTVPMVGVKYTSVTCEDSCKITTPASVFCVDDSVCNSSTSCQQSATLPPGYLVCRASL